MWLSVQETFYLDGHSWFFILPHWGIHINYILVIICNKQGCHALYLQFRWICGVYHYDLKGLSKSFSLFLIGSAKSFSWRGWVKGISSLPDRVFSLWLCLFSPQFSVCTNYFRTAKIHICTVVAALENKNATSSFVVQKFYVWMWRINRHYPCRTRCHLLEYNRRTLQGFINNSWGLCVTWLMGAYESHPQKKRMPLFYQTILAHKVVQNPLTI